MSGVSAVAVVGPTAIGKTTAAIELARLLDGRAEILSADSVQVYRRLDIGSAKPNASEREQAVFHLIDLADPDENFTLSDFQQAALAAYEEVRRRGNIAIIAGGTGLYIRSLTQPLGLPHVPPDSEFREKWRDFVSEQGQDALYHILMDRDAEAAGRLHPNDTKRIVRALEVLEKTGKRLSDWHREDRKSGSALLPEVALFGLNTDRAKLHAAIDSRVAAMMAAGFFDEVKGLRSQGYSPLLKSMQSLGYKELNGVIDGASTLEDAVEEIKLRTRQFARRQLIWFRADPRIAWIDVEAGGAGAAADVILSSLKCSDRRPATRAEALQKETRT